LSVPSPKYVGVLFDKDGTFVDFDATWGPATHAIIHALAGGDPALMRAQAETLHFRLDEDRFAPTSPLISGSSASYGALWGEALGRSDIAALKREIDKLAEIESLKALTPIGEPAAALGALKAMGLRLGVATNDAESSARRQIAALGLDEAIEFIAGYDSGHGGKPDPGMVVAFARQLGVAPQSGGDGRRLAPRSRSGARRRRAGGGGAERPGRSRRARAARRPHRRRHRRPAGAVRRTEPDRLTRKRSMGPPLVVRARW
jgi:phosphoglycolate phosphatase